MLLEGSVIDQGGITGSSIQDIQAKHHSLVHGVYQVEIIHLLYMIIFRWNLLFLRNGSYSLTGGDGTVLASGGSFGLLNQLILQLISKFILVFYIERAVARSFLL